MTPGSAAKPEHVDEKHSINEVKALRQMFYQFYKSSDPTHDPDWSLNLVSQQKYDVSVFPFKENTKPERKSMSKFNNKLDDILEEESLFVERE